MTWPEGRKAVEFLLSRDRLETIDPGSAASAASAILGRATVRLATAKGGLEVGDASGAYAVAYDAYRMAAEALLACQGLRATGGEGSHMTVEDAICAQFHDEIAAYSKPTFERFRRTRHSARYFDPSAAPITDDEAEWAIDTAERAVDAARTLMDSNPPDQFS